VIDEVTDCGEHLLVKRGAVDDKMFLSDIEDVIDRPYGRPPKAMKPLSVSTAISVGTVWSDAEDVFRGEALLPRHQSSKV